MNLSVCIITKNESHKLSRLLSSVEKLDCEIVVVDTGSTDDTIETAYRYTERVFFYKWKNNFAEAKNHVASLASCDVVMILDTDEWITDFGQSERAALEELVSKLEDPQYGSTHVGRINRINILEKEGERQENREWINRIYNRRFFEYEGSIHEQLVCKDAGQKDDCVMERSAVKIFHDGYLGTPEEKKKKAERNKKLLLKELEDLRKNEKESDRGFMSKITYVLYQLGKSCYMAGDPAGAVTYFDEALGYDLDPKLEYVIDMVETYGYALINSGQESKALGLEGVMDAFGVNADFCFMMGLVYMKNAMFDKALFCFDEAMDRNECRTKGVNSYLAHYNKGVIFECLGQSAKAAECYEKAGDYAKAKEGLARLAAEAKKE